MQIIRYELTFESVQEVSVPRGAEILSTAAFNWKLCVWAMVDPSREMEVRVIEIIDTAVSDTAVARKFIGTVVQLPFARHVFERLR